VFGVTGERLAWWKHADVEQHLVEQERQARERGDLPPKEARVVFLGVAPAVESVEIPRPMVDELVARPCGEGAKDRGREEAATAGEGPA